MMNVDLAATMLMYVVLAISSRGASRWDRAVKGDSNVNREL